MTTPRAIRPARRGRADDDRGSMPLAVLLTLVGMMLSSVLASIVTSEFDRARASTTRVHALHAAQAGLDTAVGRIRAADDGTGTGLLSRLPCGPMEGTAGPEALRYRVQIYYLDSDPQGWTLVQVQAAAVQCRKRTTPYAYLLASGTDVPTGDIDTVAHRTVQATYSFRTTNENIPGGLIHTWPASGSPDLCITANAAMTAVTTQRCSPGDRRQTFAYNQNLTITLVASKDPASGNPLGRCLDAGADPPVGTVLHLAPCANSTTEHQQWSYTGGGAFIGTTDGVTLDGYCLEGEDKVSPEGSRIVLKIQSSCVSKTQQPSYAWLPDPAVGAGAAATNPLYLVNQAQFGRCLDLNGGDPAHWLIAYGCKQLQELNGNNWNQEWTLPTLTTTADGTERGTGTVRVTARRYAPARVFCMRRPAVTDLDRLARVAPCTGGPDQTWTVYRRVRGADGSVDYDRSYRIVDDSDANASLPDAQKQCLAVDPNLATTGAVSDVVVAPCSKSPYQKWNAPANSVLPLPLKDIGER